VTYDPTSSGALAYREAAAQVVAMHQGAPST
jgi:hypothetical protein